MKGLLQSTNAKRKNADISTFATEDAHITRSLQAMEKMSAIWIVYVRGNKCCSNIWKVYLGVCLKQKGYKQLIILETSKY